MAKHNLGSIVCVNGTPPQLDFYACFATAASTVSVTLLGENGEYIYKGTMTVTSPAAALKTLVLAAGASADQWASAAGATVQVLTVGPVYLNTGANGTEVQTAPTATSHDSWTLGNTYAIGWVN